MKRKSMALVLSLMLAMESGSICVYAEEFTDAAVVDFADEEEEQTEEIPEYSEEPEAEINDSSDSLDFSDDSESINESAETESLFTDGGQTSDEITVEEETAEASGISWGASGQTLPTDVTAAGSGCVLLGVKGSYLSGMQSALNEINQIRKEACDEGVPDPRDSSRKLTPSDYVPIKWSADLEYIARIRAAEASVGALTTGHTRLNGQRCFSLVSPNGIQSWGEVLAWNWSTSVVTGIRQWYDEKTDWVKQNLYEETGHYTQMIDPSNTYVGVASFINPETAYRNATAGEFSSTGRALDQSGGSEINNCTQIVEIDSDWVNGSITGLKEKIKVSEKSTAGVEMSAYYSTVVPVKDIIWRSSDPAVASVDSQGVVTGCKAGKATITANVEGLEWSKNIEVEGQSAVPPAAVTGTKIGGRAADALRLNWNRNTAASGYIVEQKKNGSWTRIRKIEGNSTTTLRVENLKAATKYEFRIKAYSWDNTSKASLYSAYTYVSGTTSLPNVTGAVIGGRAADALRLNWNRNTAASGYIVEQKKNGSWTRIKKIEGNNTVTLRVENLKAATKYEFRIRAYSWDNTSKVSVYSNYTYVSGTTNLSNVTGAKIGGRAADAIRLNWNRNTAASGYIIEQKKNGSWTRIKKIEGNNTVTLRVEKLNPWTKYEFRIKAYHWNSREAVSIYSNYAYVSGTTNPSNVTGLRIGGRASNALRLNWNRNTSALGYIIEQKKNDYWTPVTRIAGNTTTTFRVEKLKASMKYEFRIKVYSWDSSAGVFVYSGYTNISGTTLK